VNELRETLLRTAEDLQKQQLDPLLARTRTFLLGVADDVRDKYTAPLADQVKKVLLDTLQDMQKTHGRPFLDALNRLPEQVLGSMKTALKAFCEDVVFVEWRRRASWAGGWLFDFILGTTLLAVAVVFVCVGTVLALQALGVPHWCTYLIVGSAAASFGLLFYWRWRLVVQPRLPKEPIRD
jgi:hypothetical protein